MHRLSLYVLENYCIVRGDLVPLEEFCKWHKQSYLFGGCDFCGVETLLVNPFEEDGIPG